MHRFAFLIVALALAFAMVVPAGAQGPPGLSSNATVFATGLNNPRGLHFAPDGFLYVAEAGTGGTTSTVGQCPQVPTPVGPYTGARTARISKISPQGARTTLVDNLPSAQAQPAVGSPVQGVMDLAFVGSTLYALNGGGGCSHGFPNNPAEIIRVNSDGSTTHLSNLSDWLAFHPVANPDPDDFEPDGTWYSMLWDGTNFFAIEPNHQELDRIGTDGHVARVVDLSVAYPGKTAWQGPTAMALHDGSFYVGTLTPFPIVAGKAHILKIDPNGQFSVFASGLTAVLGVAFDSQGQLYALETSAGVSGQGPPVAPFTGRVVRVASSGLVPVATGLMFPTAMTFGPDGKLYVSNFGFGGKPGDGQIVRVDPAQPVSAPAASPPAPAASQMPKALPSTGGPALGPAILLAAFGAIGVGWRLRKRVRRR